MMAVAVKRITFTPTAMGIAEKKRIHLKMTLNEIMYANAPLKANNDVRDLRPEQASTTSSDVFARCNIFPSRKTAIPSRSIVCADKFAAKI